MIHQTYIGCDIGKFAIDIFDPDGSRLLRIDNVPEALEAFAASLDPASSFVVMEATGGYDRLLRHALSAAGIAHRGGGKDVKVERVRRAVGDRKREGRQVVGRLAVLT